MAGKNVGRLFQRVCQNSARGTLTALKQGAKTVVTESAKKPFWLFAAAPFVYDSPKVCEPNDDDDDEEYEWVDEDDDEEEEETYVRSSIMKGNPTVEQYENWSENAESNPRYRQTVSEARKILQNPPPPPPQFPEFPAGFCVDEAKVPPVPPSLPALRFMEFREKNNNNSLPASCPKARPPIAETSECPSQHMRLTPRIPEMPSCDKPVPPPMLPVPPPCGELGPPPPPPPSPPAILTIVERPPPQLPAPPPMYYELPPPPVSFEPKSSGKVPPLPCLPEKMSGASMTKCSNDNNDTLSQIDKIPTMPSVPSLPQMRVVTNNSAENAKYLPPPPPPISTAPISVNSYWRDELLSKEKKKKLKRVKKKRRSTIDQDQTANTLDQSASVPVIEVAPEKQKEEEQENFEVMWSTGRRERH